MDNVFFVIIYTIALLIWIAHLIFVNHGLADEVNRLQKSFSSYKKQLDNKNSKELEKEISSKFEMEFRSRMFELEQTMQAREAKLLEQKQNNEIWIAKEKQDIENDKLALSQIVNVTKSNLSAIPYIARCIADYDTRELSILAQQLDWGHDTKRLKKAQSIREIKRETADQIARYKEAEYKLAYALEMFPALEEFLDTDYNTIQGIILNDLSDEVHDETRRYLSKEEYQRLSATERNQLALDRYRESHKKSKWQIGRDYELYIGYRYEKKGYKVNYFGSVNNLDDLGRDLIAEKDGNILIIQCKYWSAHKQIHEKHINQLYGTMMCYCFEHNIPTNLVHGVLVTNIFVSDTARRFAHFLGIELAENIPHGDYPCIKCNINRSREDGTTKIYHLPFDQMYDACQISQPGEFMAMTVAEAEAAGFRRAYRWHGHQ